VTAHDYYVRRAVDCALAAESTPSDRDVMLTWRQLTSASPPVLKCAKLFASCAIVREPADKHIRQGGTLAPLRPPRRRKRPANSCAARANG
jgi:hypothetical protein